MKNQKNEIIVYPSDIGPIVVFYNEDYLIQVCNQYEEIYNHKQNLISRQIEEQFRGYFDGKIKLVDLPILLQGSQFELDVLKTILKIPYGETWSYKQLATKSGHPTAIRAVASVCRKNKYPIIIPCHRVIKSDGSYGKYIFGNDAKKFLIHMERNYKTN